MKLRFFAAACVLALNAFGGATAASLSSAASAAEFTSEVNTIKYYSGESSVSYYVNVENTLFAAGNNGNGEFGDGAVGGARYTPKEVLKNIVCVADGKSGFALALSSDGKLYAWGNNRYSQLGLGTAYNDDSATNKILTPVTVKIDGDPTISAIAAGDAYSMILTDTGAVYTCGKAQDGQTGIEGLNPVRKTVVSTFTRVDGKFFGGEKVKKIAACENTAFALSESGKIFVWGANDKGLLASNSTDENVIYETPVEIALDAKIKDISAQTMTVMAIGETGVVYVWGDNSVHQTGRADIGDVVVPFPVEISEYYSPDGAREQITPAAVLCGGRTNFVLSDSGNIYAFGAAGKGQAAINVQSEKYLSHSCVVDSNVVSPLRIQFYETVSLEFATASVLEEYKDKIPVTDKVRSVKISQLINSIGDRTFVKDSDGAMWSWGINLYAMTCSGDAYDCVAPVSSTLYRKTNYDAAYAEKNYMIKPAIVMGCVLVFAVVWFVLAEIKIRRRIKAGGTRE